MADQARLYSADLPSPNYVDLDVLAVRGASEPDSVSKFPGIIHEYLDGSLSEQIVGGRRNIQIDFAIITAAQRRKAALWWLDPDRQLRSTLSKPATPSGVVGSGGTLNGTYKFRICAIDTVNHSEVSDASGATTPGVQAVTLSWTASSGARRYKVFRSHDADYDFWDLIDYSETNSYVDTGSTPLKANIATADLPGSTEHIHVIATNELEFQWLDNTELHRMLTLELREDSIFTQAQQFPV